MENEEFEVDPDFGVSMPKSQKKGIVLPFDDLKVDDWITVYKIKEVDTPQPIYGQAIKVTSICLPFVIGRMAGNQPITLDSRFLEVMRISEEYATAQNMQVGVSPEQSALAQLEKLIRPR
jgi:hypothetical protein